jgi:hypothetical protein
MRRMMKQKQAMYIIHKKYTNRYSRSSVHIDALDLLLCKEFDGGGGYWRANKTNKKSRARRVAAAGPADR